MSIIPQKNLKVKSFLLSYFRASALPFWNSDKILGVCLRRKKQRNIYVLTAFNASGAVIRNARSAGLSAQKIHVKKRMQGIRSEQCCRCLFVLFCKDDIAGTGPKVINQFIGPCSLYTEVVHVAAVGFRVRYKGVDYAVML